MGHGTARARSAPETPAASAGDTISVQSVHAALELDLINHLDPNSLPVAGAADYQLARVAAAASETSTSMQHLEIAVHESPAYASVALEDPAFNAMRGPVQELVDRVTYVAGSSQSAAAGTYQPTRIPTPLPPPVLTDQAVPPSAPADAGPAPVHSALPSPQSGRPVASPLPSPAPSTPIQLPRAIDAALDLALLRSWDTEPARFAAAAEYQLAQNAAQSGDRSSALQHLEQAILAHPAQAAAALSDPAFDSIKYPVHDLVARLTGDARVHAESAGADARLALQSAGAAGLSPHLLTARSYLDAAQASLQLGTYTGLVQAAYAADLARRIATGERSETLSRLRLGGFEPVKRALQRGVRNLWRKLPLLAILLGWFLAGVLAAVVSLLFETGGAFRASLFPGWALGLLTLVVVGFVRSILRLRRDLR